MDAKTNILMVDDKPENLIALDAILADLNQNLIKANSGQDALRLVLKNDFSVILMDVQMPGMDGYETANLIREREQSKNIPIIFLTAIYESDEYINKGYSSGAVDYLFKPFSPEILRSKVRIFVDLFLYREQAKQNAVLKQSEKDLRKYSIELEAINKKLAQEINERKIVEQELKDYTRKLEASNRNLEDFAYIASHDLQEPLRKVLTFSDRLGEKYQGQLDETGKDYFNRMRDATIRMQTLITDLLAYSRVGTQAKPFSEVHLSDVVKNVVVDLELRKESCHGSIQVSELPDIQADATQMYQLFQNLIGNALKFHAEGVSPEIKVFSEKKNKEEYQISVADNGIGFEQQYIDRIFKPFQRLVTREAFEGTGIGLAVCKRIVDRHHGTISALSNLGKGSTFIVTLPINQKKDEKKLCVKER